MHLPHVLLFEMMMESVGAFISFLTAYQSLRAFRVLGRRPLLYLHFGFTLLGVGMVSRVFASLYVVSAASPGVVGRMASLSSLTCGLVRLASYGLFAAALSETRMKVEAAVLLPLLVNPYTEFLCVAVMVYVVARSAMNYALTSSDEGLLVFAAFLLMLVGHVFFALSPFRPFFYLLGHVSQLAGFLSMLAMLVRVGRGVGEG